jgi:hypothetical protein
MSQSGGHRDGNESLREGGTPSTSDVFALLADEERQVLVRHLLAQSEPMVGVSDLVELLAETFEYDRTRAVLRLRHDHLPRLAAHRFLDYDEKRSLVWFDDQADHADHDALRTLLETAEGLSTEST